MTRQHRDTLDKDHKSIMGLPNEKCKFIPAGNLEPDLPLARDSKDPKETHIKLRGTAAYAWTLSVKTLKRQKKPFNREHVHTVTVRYAWDGIILKLCPEYENQGSVRCYSCLYTLWVFIQLDIWSHVFGSQRQTDVILHVNSRPVFIPE